MKTKMLTGERVNVLVTGSLPLRAEDFRADKKPAARAAVPFVAKVVAAVVVDDVWDGRFV